jgi:hypothetical protein
MDRLVGGSYQLSEYGEEVQRLHLLLISRRDIEGDVADILIGRQELVEIVDALREFRE